jgi:hypothetical protein
MRPTWYDFPHETELYDNSKQFMFGSALLVIPKTTSIQLSPNDLSDPDQINKKIYPVEFFLPSTDQIGNP